MVVLDASPLIVLAKIRRLNLIHGLYREAVIGKVVQKEVVEQGRAISAPGLEQVERVLEERWLRPVSLAPSEREWMRRALKRLRIDEGEAEALALARSRGFLLVVDDKEARAAAAAFGVSYTGTVGVLLEAMMSGFLRCDEFEDTITQVSRVMWLSPAVVAEVLRRAREWKR